MNPACHAAMRKGQLLKVQNFETVKGIYRITHVRYKGDVFMFKTRDGELLECMNLSKMKGVDEP